MEIAIHLPDDIAQRVRTQWEDIPRHVLESFVLDGFRARLDHGGCQAVAEV